MKGQRLHYQYAACRHYNRAETLKDLVWMCRYLRINDFLPFFIDIMELSQLENDYQCVTAFSLKKYFDVYI